jgi:hypothetical protein
MKTVLVEIKNEKALALLRNLESMKLLRLLDEDTATPAQNLSDKYAGKLSKEVAEELQNHIEKSRSEWERDI